MSEIKWREVNYQEWVEAWDMEKPRRVTHIPWGSSIYELEREPVQLPTQQGAIVGKPEGNPFVFDGANWWTLNGDNTEIATDWRVIDAIENFGYTVLFEGVA